MELFFENIALFESVSRIPENSESKMIIIILAQIGVLKENSSTPGEAGRGDLGKLKMFGSRRGAFHEHFQDII